MNRFELFITICTKIVQKISKKKLTVNFSKRCRTIAKEIYKFELSEIRNIYETLVCVYLLTNSKIEKKGAKFLLKNELHNCFKLHDG